jgi:antitoxin component of RelBE/YafQ-DinJ toxin-antitoxin module
MPRTIGRAAESTLNLRVDAKLKMEFAAATEAEDRPASEVLRTLMRDYVEGAKKRQFAAEARRQSKLIATSEDESEVMRWIQNVSAQDTGR